MRASSSRRSSVALRAAFSRASLTASRFSAEAHSSFSSVFGHSSSRSSREVNRAGRAMKRSDNAEEKARGDILAAL